MAKPTNIEQLRDSLLESYEDLKRDPRRHNQAKEMANTAGKIISTLGLQLEYAAMRKEMPCIDFLGGEEITPVRKLQKQIHREIEASKDKE